MNLFASMPETGFKQAKGVTDPEKKRKIIGEEFIRVFEESPKSAARIILCRDNLPDVIESGLVMLRLSKVTITWADSSMLILKKLLSSLGVF